LGSIPKLSADCSRPGEATRYDCKPGLEIVGGNRAMFDRRSCPKPNAPVTQHGACHGDSGGAVYVAADSRLYLAGVIRAINDKKKCGCAHATNVYVRMDKQLAWLRGLKSKSSGAAIRLGSAALKKNPPTL
jgi:hypothetical protein